MIAQLKGKILEASIEKDFLHAIVDVQGVGYEVVLSRSSDLRVQPNTVMTLFISESVTAFDGATTLYGFVSREEKDLFTRIRENVDGMGPKKALECLDKITKSLPDFKRAVIDGDIRLLVSVFGFTKKTAEKLIFALKGKVDTWVVSGSAKWQEAAKSPLDVEALTGLLSLGYPEEEARELLQKAKATLPVDPTVENVLKEALRIVGARLS